jgi:HD-like signal output (HDOD) protein
MMFGKWITRSVGRPEVERDALAALAPFASASVDALDEAAAVARRIEVRQGLVDEALPAGHQVFLQQGSMQIQTHSGFVLRLTAATPATRFPLPLKPMIGSLYAAEPCVLLGVPDSATHLQAATAPTGMQRPDMTADETETLNELRRYFRRQRCDLPSLPDLALKIGKAIDDDSNGNGEVAKLIQLDPALTARIISVVNSAAFGGLKKIKSVQQATARLGRRKVRSLVYSCLLKGIFRINSRNLKQRMEELWQHSAYVAALSFVLGRETPGIDPEQALLAGLIHDIGSVAVIGGINRYPLLARRPEVLDYAIHSLRLEAGMLTLKSWNLEEEFAEVILNAENWYRMGTAIPDNSDVVILAQLHALIGKRPQGALPPIDTLPAFLKLAHGELTPRHSLGLLEEAESDVREVRALIGVG